MRILAYVCNSGLNSALVESLIHTTLTQIAVLLGAKMYILSVKTLILQKNSINVLTIFREHARPFLLLVMHKAHTKKLSNHYC